MKQRAVVSLDMLLDTRYGTLRRMNPVVADALIGTDEYRRRHTDNFEAMTQGVILNEEYEDLYNKRDVHTLLESRFTDFIYEQRMDFIEGASHMDRGVLVSELTFDINIWPYELTRQEMSLIRMSIEHYMPRSTVKVNIVNLPPELLTPLRIESSYEMMAWYNHEDWLRHHTDALIAHPLPTTPLLTPMIASSGIVPEPTQEVRDPFLSRSATLCKFLTLHYLPVATVCHNPFIPRQVETQRRSASAHNQHPHPEQDQEQEASDS